MPLFNAVVQGEPVIQGHEILSRKIKVLGAAQSEEFVSLHRFDTIPQCNGQSDKRTDRHLDDDQDARSITYCRA